MSSEKITSALVAELLALTSTAEQSSFLEMAGLRTADGLAELLDFAGDEVGNNPGQTRQLAALCAELAEAAGASLLVPQATYLRAQTHAIQGDYSQAGALIRSAREQYLSLGQPVSALRTNVGLISVLAEEGQYQEAIEVGRSTLDTIEKDRPRDLTPANANRLSGLIHKNLGICYELIGNYHQALRALSMAEALFQEVGMAEESAALAMSRGSILLNLGRAEESLTALQAAAAVFADMDNQLRQAKCLNNLGNAHLVLGNYGESLDTLKEARRLLNNLDARADQLITQGLMADAYLALNLFPEAIAEYQAANEGLREMGAAYQRAWVLWGLGAAYMKQSQWEMADPVLVQAASLFREADNQQLLGAVMLEQAAMLAARGDREGAVQLAYQAHQLVANKDWPVQRVLALLRLADLVIPDLPLARMLLEEAQQLVITLALPHLRYRLRQRLGHLHMLQGRDEIAETLLQAAVTEIEQLRGNLTQETIRASFLRDKVAAFEDLAQLYLARGDEISLQKALNVTEQAKSRTLVELLLGVVDVKLSTKVQAEEANRLQKLRAELDAIYNQALRGSQEGERGVPWFELNERATALENEISRLRLELADIATSPPKDMQALPFDLLQAQLPSDLILLIYHILGDEVLVFVIADGHLRVKQHLADVSTLRSLLQDLDIEWARFQAGEDFVHRHIEHLEQSVKQVLNRLYVLLVAPIVSWLPSVEGKVPPVGIVPHGILHQVPFQALFDGRQYLIDRFEIVYAPSATLLAHYQKQKPLRAGQKVIFGVSDPLIPHVVAEVHAVARHLPYADLCIDEKATRTEFQTRAPHCSVLHLACHGLFRADNPMFSAVRLYDGWLTAADVMTLDLTDAFVALSVCESGRSDGLRSEEILGFTRAFLGAGAQALIVTLWLIDDELSVDIMAGLYEQLAQGANYTAALRNAQLAMKEKRPHPYYWAPFIVIGRMASSSQDGP